MLRGWAPEALLDSYHAERHAAALENLEVTDGDHATSWCPARRRRRGAPRATCSRGRPTDPAARAQVDSGRLAEPFWYVDSPLTTPDAPRPFAGRPARGDVPPPGPGRAGARTCRARRHRLRALAREGVMVLLGDDGAHRQRPRPAGGRRTGSATSTGPHAADALGARPDEIWVLRPDAHVAAVLTRAEIAPRHCRRAPAPSHRKENDHGVLPQRRRRSRPSGTPSTAAPTAGSTPRS